MTDNEIIKALECCKINDCENCPYENLLKDSYGCVIMSTIDAIELIKRQQEEIDLLKMDNERMTTKVFEMAMKKVLKEKVRAEAIKEFAERVKDICRPFPMHDDYECNTIYEKDIDNLVKEMVGGADNG